MKKNIIFLTFICVMALSLCGSVAATDDMNTTNLTSNRHIFIEVANDEGVKYNFDGTAYGGPNNTYYIKCDGGGLNALHITNDSTNQYGQVTVVNSTSTSSSGVSYLTDTGGRGFNDDIILMLAVQGPIPDNFTVRIRSSGYGNWTLLPPGNSVPPNSYMPPDPSYKEGAIDQIFTKDDFQYGPQIYKPGPGTLGTWSLPLYFGQSTSDSSTAMYLMFIDLYRGTLKNSALIDGGAVKVEYWFTNMNTIAAFNMYGWCIASNQGQGISWTQDTTGTSSSGRSGYTVNYTPVAPVANFTADTTSGSAPLTVKFTDKSTNYPTSWTWDFGDGTTSTEQNPTHTYSTSGTYTVKLTASNLANNSTVTDYINVSKSGVFVQITPSKTNPQVGDKVTYTFKLGNNGPDVAKDVVFTYVIPEGLEFAGANVDQGTWTYNATTRTLTWNVGDVIVKPDPYLWLDLRVLRAGSFSINPVVTVAGINIGSGGNIGSLFVNAVSVPTVNAATNTIPMQETGVPLTGLTMGLLLVGSGLALGKRK